MDVIEFLENDHNKLRKDLVRIKQNLTSDGTREVIKTFMIFLELHESVEEEILFPELEILPEGKIKHDFLFGFEEQHTKVWELLDHLTNSMNGRDFPKIQEIFFKFCAFAESHFSFEERVLFPEARKLLTTEKLTELGARAEERASKFLVN